jgi:hypothetical protein
MRAFPKPPSASERNNASALMLLMNRSAKDCAWDFGGGSG